MIDNLSFFLTEELKKEVEEGGKSAEDIIKELTPQELLTALIN